METAAKKKILLVEDDMLLAALTEMRVSEFGYDVAVVATGEEAVERATGAELFDLVLMDIDLGCGIDGTVAAQRILARRMLPIVFLTSHAEEAMVKKVRGITRYGYVIKSSGDFVLQSSIEMALELYSAHCEIEVQLANLRESREQFDYALDAVNDAVWDYKPVAEKLYWNPRYYTMLGYEANQFEPSIAVWESLVHPDDLPEAKACFGLCLDGGADEFVRELRLRMADGRYRWILVRGRVHERDLDGRVVRMIGTHVDIDERKRAEDERLAVDNLLEDILDAIPSGLFIFRYEESGRMLLVRGNRAAERLSGVGPGDTGRDVAEIWSAVGKERLVRQYRVVREGGRSIEIGNVVYAEAFPDVVFDVRVFPVRGDMMGVVFDDVTAKKKAEQSLAESEALFNQLLEHSPIYIFFKDENIRAVKLSRNYETMIGRPLDEILGRSMDDLFPSDLAKAMIEDDKRILHQGKEVRVDEELGDRCYTTIKFPISVAGHPRYLAGFTIDITERKRILDEVSKAREDIARLLGEKELLLREVHHRIKNNMSTISSLLSLQAKRIGDGIAASALVDAQNRVNSMRTIYDNLLQSDDFHGIQAGKYLSELVASIAAVYETETRVRVRTESVELVLDSQILFPVGMIVNELLTNSYKYAFAGRPDGEICIRLAQTGPQAAEISYQDNGVGIPASVSGGDGEGFGMKLVRMLVRQLGGTIEWSSGQGTGCRFTFDF